MFELWREPKVSEYAGPSLDATGRPIEMPVREHADSDRLLDYWLQRAKAGTGFRWAVRQRTTGEFLGAVGFNAVGSEAEYAYHFAPRHWGHGFAREASQLAIAWAFETGAQSIDAFVERANARSIALVERLGFAAVPGGDAELERFQLRAGQPRAARPAVILRPTTAADLSFVTQLELEPENHPFIGHWPAERHTEVIERSDREHWIVETAGGVERHGFLIAFDLRAAGNGVYLKRIAVTPRGMGLGAVAVSQFLSHALEDLSAGFVWLAVVPDNLRAQRMYESLGFDTHPVRAENGNRLMWAGRLPESFEPTSRPG